MNDDQTESKPMMCNYNSTIVKKNAFTSRLGRLVFAVSLFTAFISEAQRIDEVNISLHMNKAKVSEVLQQIEDASTFAFAYQENLIANVAQRVSVRAESATVAEVLDGVTQQTPLAFKQINGKTIAVSQKPPQKAQLQQQIRISGTVFDTNGMPLPSTSVVEKGTSNGVTTDFDGNYSITVSSPDAVLVFSFVGFTSQEVPLKGKTVLLVTLEATASELDEVVLIGYGSRKGRTLTTAVSKVNYENLKDQNIVSFEQALQGQIAGVRISESTGAPGGNVSVKIRGTGTLGNAEPLYVIDGVPLDNDLRGALGTVSPNEQPTNPLATINPEDIASVNVLKDAASTAIYGSRGANGVVIITTKSGKQGKIKVDYKWSSGMQSVLRKLDLLNAYEYAQLRIDGQNENYMNNNPGGNPNRAITDPNAVRGNRGAIAPEFFPYAAGIKGLTDTDWQDEIFRIAERNEHNLSVSGGSEHSNYFVSGNILKQEGIVINSEFDRYAFRMKYNVDYDNIKFGINLAPSFSDQNIVQTEGPFWQGGVISAANVYAPVFPVYNPDGTFNYGNNNWGYGHDNIINPVATASLLRDRKQQYRVLGNAFLDFKIANGLTNKVSVGVDLNNFKRDTYSPTTLEVRGQSAGASSGRSRATFTRNLLLENTLNYNKTFGALHNIRVFGSKK